MVPGGAPPVNDPYNNLMQSLQQTDNNEKDRNDETLHTAVNTSNNNNPNNNPETEAAFPDFSMDEQSADVPQLPINADAESFEEEKIENK